jgi:hypothetical protein
LQRKNCNPQLVEWIFSSMSDAIMRGEGIAAARNARDVRLTAFFARDAVAAVIANVAGSFLDETSALGNQEILDVPFAVGGLS